MTIQQLQYVVAVDKYRHFVKAAESCGVTQSTLSSMIRKLEEELDVTIFDRDAHPIVPTVPGVAVIEQARVILFNADQLKESLKSERQQEAGDLRMGIIPTVSPYILPGLFKEMDTHYPQVKLHVTEALTQTIVGQLNRAELDVALITTPLGEPGLLEIPVYYEKFVFYVSPKEPIYSQEVIESMKLPTEHLWILREGHCLRRQVLNICHKQSGYSTIYESGSIDTLIRIIDANGGYTVIPELHIPLLTPEQQKNVRPIVHPEADREISLVVRQDFVRERLLNILTEAIKTVIPDEMINSGLKKFAITL